MYIVMKVHPIVQLCYVGTRLLHNFFLPINEECN